MAAGQSARPQRERSAVTVADDGASLLEVLRDRAGIRSAEGRMQPAGPVRLLHRARRRRATGRVRDSGPPCGRPIDHDARGHGRTGGSVGPTPSAATGASQCGFCTPGIIVRLDALRRAGVEPRRHRPRRACAPRTPVPVHRLAHDPRRVARPTTTTRPAARPATSNVRRARASLEGGSPQRVGPDVALGGGGFADDTAPRRCARRGARRRRRLVRRRDAVEARRARGEGARTTNDRRRRPSDRVAPTATGT